VEALVSYTSLSVLLAATQTDHLITFFRGCVSGAQVCNMRDKISMGDGKFRWDAIDGYDDLA
jgi:hypothetical protein